MSTRRLSAPAVLLAAALAAGCGGSSPTGPGGTTTQPARTTVDVSTGTLAMPGDELALRATAGGQTTGTPSLTVVSEARWLDDAAVLDAASLSAGRIRAAAPGTATLDVSAFGAAPARVVVTVRPSRPLVVAATETAVGDGDVLVLRGWGMDRVAAVRVGADAAAVVSRDSATLRLSLPSVADAGCAAPRRDAVSVDGGDVVAGLTVARRHRAELRLAVGQVARLADGASGCLRLAPAADARYALAFLDARRVRAAERGYEGAPPSVSTYAVTVAEAGTAAPRLTRGPSSSPASSASPAPRRVSAAVADDGTPFARRARWSEGERFTSRIAGIASPLSFRVVRVRDGLVLAAAEGRAYAGGEAAWLARADSALAMMASQGVPLLTRVLGAAPETGAGTGQLLVLAYDEPTPALGATTTRADGGRPLSYVFLNASFTFTATGLLRTLAHEATHAWQERAAWETKPAGAAAAGGGPAWAVEGTAELVAGSVVRRSLGLGLRANWDWSAAQGDGRTGSYALLAASARGDFTAGYASAAGFGQDLVQTLVSAGRTEEDALASVVRGALEGWNGWDAHGGRRMGLAARMRAAAPGWEAADALLRWTVRQAADDLTDAPELQNPAYLRVSTAGRDRGLGWLPAAVLRGGASAQATDPAAAAVVSGNAAAIPVRYGSPGYVWLEDGGTGGAYALSASAAGAPLDDAAWMIVRIR